MSKFHIFRKGFFLTEEGKKEHAEYLKKREEEKKIREEKKAEDIKKYTITKELEIKEFGKVGDWRGKYRRGLTLEDRFFQYVSKKDEDSCWEWLGTKNEDGYGAFLYNGKMIGSHRVSWLLFNKEIEKDKIVLHTCNNPSCVNPNHLRLGTQKENVQQMFSENRDNHARGENVKVSKLKKNEPDEIRKKYENGKNMVILAKEYNVSCTCISNIISNKTWKNNDYKPHNEMKIQNSNLSKLKWNIINSIRKDYQIEKLDANQLIIKYNIPRTTINNIISNRTWYDLEYQKWLDDRWKK